MIIKIKRYYKCKEGFQEFCNKLKHAICPHCKLIGTLILHGYLRGYDEKHVNKKIVRGRRIFCNNRKRRNKGCGHTISVLVMNMLKNFCITAESLWRFFMDNLGLSSKHEEDRLKINDFPLTKSSAYRTSEEIHGNSEQHTQSAFKEMPTTTTSKNNQVRDPNNRAS